MTNFLISRVLLPGVSALSLSVTLAVPALAQSAPGTVANDNRCPSGSTAPECSTGTTTPASDNGIPGADPVAPNRAAGDEPAGQDVVVTGSRIRRPDYDTPTPVVSLGAATIQSSGSTNLTDFLSGYPALIGSSTSAQNAGSTASIGTTGLNLLNLRNLGSQRTLVLIDGRRSVSGVPGSASVDINTIPTDLVERVDVLTGGASAVYGADAVSGVVNFILKKNFEGISARAQSGLSDRGDGAKYFATVTVGKNFADGRGNVALSYQYSHDSRFQASDRDYLVGSGVQSFNINPDQTGYRRVLLNDIHYYDSSRQGAIDIDFDGLPEYVGTGQPWNHGRFVPDIYEQGGSGTLVTDYRTDLLPQLDNQIVNGFAHFDVSDKLSLFVEGKYAHTHSFSLGQPTFDYYLQINPDNAYLPANLRGIAAENGGVLLNRDNFDLGQRGEDIYRDTVRTVVGAKGDISPALHYEVSYTWGQTRAKNEYTGDQYNDRFLAAIDAVVNPATGLVTCRANITPGYVIDQPYTSRAVNGSTFTPGQCSPFNLFGEGNASPAALAFITANTTDRSLVTQQVVSGSVSGDTRDFFNLPGGAIGFAVGGEYRKETSRFTPDTLVQQGLTFTNQLGAESGRFNVKEVFGEISLPILRDQIVHSLEVDGAIRRSDYSTTGANTTWNVEGKFAPIRDISFRGTLSQAVRAPNIGELFGAPSTTFQFISDPCAPANINLGKAPRPANCAALLAPYGVTNLATFRDYNSSNIPGTSTGNLGLSPETARSWTAGAVIQPRFLRGFNLSFDWYRIRIENAISTVAPQELAELCVDQASVPNQFCSTITRQTGGTQPGKITGFTISPLNVASYETRGLDMNLSYTQKTASLGTFNIRVVGNYLDKLDFIGTPGAPVRNDVQTTFAPKFQANTDITWQLGGFTLNYGLSWFDKTRRYSEDAINGDPNLVDPQYVFYRDYWQHDVYASYDVNDRFQLYGGVNNLADRKPDIGSVSYPQSAVGRFLFVGAKVKTSSLF